MSEKLISNDNIMIKSNLEKLNQTELINLILNQEKMLKQLLQEKQQFAVGKGVKNVDQKKALLLHTAGLKCLSPLADLSLSRK